MVNLKEELKQLTETQYKKMLELFDNDNSNNYSDQYNIGMGWDINTPEEEGNQWEQFPKTLSDANEHQKKMIRRLYVIYYWL